MAYSSAPGALMRSFGTLVLAFFLSGFVAGVVQIQLGVCFRADLELVLAMVALMAMTFITTLALGVALAFARSVSAIATTAGVLIGLTVLALVLLTVVGGALPRRQDVVILSEIFVPIAIMVVIQWWLVRRRWRRAHSG